MLVEELIERGSAWARSYYTTKEASNVQDALRALHHLVHVAGPLDVAGLRPVHFVQVREQLVDQGLARTTINGRMKRIRRVLVWAAEQELVPAAALAAARTIAPLRRGRCKAREAPGIKPVSFEQVTSTAEFLSPAARAAVWLLWWTGARVGEILSLRACDVDRSGPVWSYTPARHKLSSLGIERVVMIGPRGQEVLRPWLGLGLPLFPEHQVVSPFVPVFKLSVQGLSAAVQRATWMANIRTQGRCQPWTPLGLRHSAAQRIRESQGIESARCVLGHRAASTTEIYTSDDLVRARSVAGLVG